MLEKRNVNINCHRLICFVVFSYAFPHSYIFFKASFLQLHFCIFFTWVRILLTQFFETKSKFPKENRFQLKL